MLEARDLEGIVLRYGGSYGPGTPFEPSGDLLAAVRRRRFPIVGDGKGMVSLVHIDDVAQATLAAIERGRPGVYNVVDDEPAPFSELLSALAAMLGAKPPRRVPIWLGRLMVGEQGCR